MYIYVPIYIWFKDNKTIIIEIGEYTIYGISWNQESRLRFIDWGLSDNKLVLLTILGLEQFCLFGCILKYIWKYK